jgi:formylglycine-generating enzyme required for sulfatase activity
MAAASLAGCTSGTPLPPGAGDRLAGRLAGQQKTIADIALRWCPPGSFRMGTPASEPERRSDETQTDVTLTSGFWIGERSLTQGEWQATLGHLPGELSASAGTGLPVYNVNHPEAAAFCETLSARLAADGSLPEGWAVRLPTEAQWEYACRAGTTTATSFGDSLGSRQANFRGDHPYNGAPAGPVLGHVSAAGVYPANAWGLHDMHGNVFDWCRDWFHTRLPGGVDPDLSLALDTAARNGDGSISRSRRGGCWSDQGWACRSGFRMKYEPERRADHIGFRITVSRR